MVWVIDWATRGSADVAFANAGCDCKPASTADHHQLLFVSWEIKIIPLCATTSSIFPTGISLSTVIYTSLLDLEAEVQG